MKTSAIRLSTIVFGLAIAASACGSSSKGSIDADPSVDGSGDASVSSGLPTWKLQDVQPLSAKTGQTYGLDTFSGKIVVVSLLEGF
jgi:hypothetical protein